MYTHTPTHTYTPPLITDAESRALVASGRRRHCCSAKLVEVCPSCQSTEMLMAMLRNPVTRSRVPEERPVWD